MADTAKCSNCRKEFTIPKKSIESAGDWESWGQWAVKDIKCPNCGTVVYKKGADIDGWQTGGY